MKAKKIISFCSLFSLVLILSVYYALTPAGVMDQGVSNIQQGDGVNVEVVDGENAYFKNLDILKETSYLEEMKNLDAIVASKDTTSEEKVAALENKSEKTKINENEKKLTQLIKEKGYNNAYVEYENGNINILVSKKDATSKDAENIISLIYGEGITNKTPIVSFKG